MAERRRKISLAGEWSFFLDRENTGIREKWYDSELTDRIALPGTTDEAQQGDFVDERCVDRLSRIWRWIGPAWYQRKVVIPKEWKRKRISLFLERTKDSQVWVDGEWMGSDDSLSTPHQFDLSAKLAPGQHTITILVDNGKLPPVGPCHQVDERTQTNWNGILGRIELVATDPVWVDDLQAYPLLATQVVCVKACVGNSTRSKVDLSVSLSAEVIGQKDGVRIRGKRFKVQVSPGKTEAVFDFPMPEGVPLWDEFERPLLRLTMRTNGVSRGRTVKDECSIRFGMRQFSASRGQFVINGRPTFLRGKNDCALFPLTGYAPMDKAEWKRLLGVAVDYGINHYRFHSWCPPGAAFEAADELGVYFHVELPNKRGITEPDNKNYRPPQEAYETLDELEGDGGPPAVRTAYLYREGERMLKAYGNHPSFVMMTLGNELGGDVEVMRGMCDHFRSLDDRHLYAMGTGHFHWAIKYRPGDEFWVTRGTGAGLSVRGASWESECHVDHKPPSTTVDYREALQGVPVPVVGHEMAQYEVFPDLNEEKKYRGVLKARFFDIIRQRLTDAGMLDQMKQFQKASGALSVICHREDVEAALRTPGFGGFQMLDLQDFSGQGVALIGMLDVFMDSKGLITPGQWREFCCETVPLLWFTKYTWTNDETFTGGIRVAHYGPRDLESQSVKWRVMDGRRVAAKGESRRVKVGTGKVTEVDLFSVSLKSVSAPAKLSVVLELSGTDYRNRYDLWVYPAKAKTNAPKSIKVVRHLGRGTLDALERGERVLLLAKPESLKQSVAMAFQGSFWSPMFRKRPGRLNPMGKETPGTQGILCDPKHPLFKDFPTEFHSNWQWWQLVKNSRAMILDSTPTEFRPLVQVVDGFDRNHKLGLVAEARVGKGRLLFCSIGLPDLQEHPEGRQLLSCILNYMKSAAFKPPHELEGKVVRSIF